MDYPCDWKAGFVMDPTKKQRVGYLVSFKGLDLGDLLTPDIEVFTPFNGGSPSYSKLTVTDDKVKVVGILENFSWRGGVGDPISISAYISGENASELIAKQKTTLKTTSLTNLGWWIGNFDEVAKEWFEEAYPKSPEEITAQLNAPGGKDIRLTVSPKAIKVSPNIDVKVHNLSFEVVPAANQTFDFHFATAKLKSSVNRWGLVVGTLPAQALAPTS